MQAGDSYVVERGVTHIVSRRVVARARRLHDPHPLGRALRELPARDGPAASGAAWASAEDEAAVTAIAAAAQITVLGPPGTLPPGFEHSAHAA